MGYMITEIMLYLLVAAILGFIIGYWLAWQSNRKKINQLESISKANLYSREEELKGYQQKIAMLTTSLDECEKARKQGAASASAEEIKGYQQKIATLTTSLDECEKARKQGVAASDVTYAEVPEASGVKQDAKDDLKKIWGIGKVLEGILNKEGIHRFSQIANFTDDMIDEFSEKIGAFPGRIRRDNWIQGAKDQFEKKYGKKI